MRRQFAAFVTFATLAILPFSGHAQQTEGPYALEGCRKGCVLVEANYDPITIFAGAVPRTYRVCARNMHVKLVVDNVNVGLRDGDCSDVNGRQIKLFNGALAYGLLPS